jgi:hypothetical protein
MVHELVYVSRSARIDCTPSELEDLLLQAREKNQRLGITGVLLYEKGEFVQLLEGDQEAVRVLFRDSIVRDPRHRRVFLCWENAKPERSFREWQMGFARGMDLAESSHPAAEGYLKHGVAGLDLASPRSTGRDLLLSLYEAVASS